MNVQELYRKALDTYGVTSQLMMVIEEMSELTKEISKYFRGDQDTQHIAEEIADVRIMLDQIELAFNLKDSVDDYIRLKLARLKGRLDEHDS